MLHAFEDHAHLLDGEARDVDAGVGLLVRLGGEAESMVEAIS
jgi:hypothetical protein